MGREPQQGTDGKQEQSQPWAESQKQRMEGKQEQGQPWVESQIRGRKAGAGTAMGREPTQGTEGKQGQGNRGRVLTHGTDSSKAKGAECLRTERTVAG